MTIEVRYYTRSGNTKKLADAIAEAVGVQAKDINEPMEEDVDLLFLGSSVYAGGVDDAVAKFIASIHVNVGKVVNFSTAAISKSTYKQVKKMLDVKKIPLAEEDFACRGSFTFMHKGHPNEEDLKAAADFAKGMLPKKKSRK